MLSLPDKSRVAGPRGKPHWAEMSPDTMWVAPHRDWDEQGAKATGHCIDRGFSCPDSGFAAPWAELQEAINAPDRPRPGNSHDTMCPNPPELCGLVWPHIVLTAPKPVLSLEHMTTGTLHALLAEGVWPCGELGAPGVGRE